MSWVPNVIQGGGGGGSVNISAGTTSNSLTSFEFSNGSGVSFGLNGSTITATVKTDYLTTAMASNRGSDFVQANAVFAGTNASGTIASNGISVSVNAGGGSLNVSAGTTSNNLTALTFSNSNGITFGLNASTITASHNALTTAMASNASTAFAATGFTTTTIGGAVIAGTHDTLGLKLAVPGYLTTAMLSNAATISNINVSAGTTSNNLSALTFSNGSGVSFGLNGSVITATVQTNYLTTAMQSNAATISNINVSAGTTSNNLSALTFSNGSGVSFGLNGSVITATVQTNYLTTAMASNRGSDFVQAGAAFAGTNASGTIASNGISVSVGNYITTARASNDAIGLNTAKTNVTWTVNSAGLSLDAGGYAGTGTTFGGTNVSGSMTLNSNGLQLSLSAPTPGGGAAVNVTAGTTSGNLQTIQFNNANNMSFGLNGSTITASFDPINIGMSTGGNTAGTSGTFDGAGLQYVLAAVNGITLSQSSNANSVTLSIVGNTDATLSQRVQWPPGNLTAVAALGNGSFSINRMDAYDYITATRMDVPFLVSLASSATANTWGLAVTAFGAVYTKNVSTLSSLSSGSTSWSISLASNTAGTTQVIAHAIRPMSIPMNVNMTPGEYYVGFGISTNTSSIGTATTALGNTWSVMGGPIYSSAVGAVGNFTEATNTSTGLFGGQGVYSAAISTVPPTVSLSAINQTGSYYARGNMGIIFRNI